MSWDKITEQQNSASSNIDELIITPYILPRLKLAFTKFESLIVEEVKFTSSKLTFINILFSIFVVGISVLINVEFVKSEFFIWELAILALLKFVLVKLELLIIA